MTWAVGVDIGGTNVRVAQVTSTGVAGCVLAEQLDPYRAGGRPFGQLMDMISSLMERQDAEPAAGIGIGATGPVDPDRGSINNPYTLPIAFRGDVAGKLSEAFGVPVRLENDSDTAALGESWTGAAAEAEVAACITVGTGIGCGVVRHDKIFRGAHGSHPEFGHQVVDPSGPACYCGAHGCVESLASAPAIVRAAIEAGAVAAGAQAADVFAAAAQDAACRAIVERAQSSLASAVVNLVAIQAPDVIVLTGNGIGDPPGLTSAIRHRLAACPFMPPGGVSVRLSRLGGAAGCIGAARLVLQRRVWS